ncbi:MAG: RNA-directed DNA polymerase [Methylococcales bacterium]|nr:RNA-directed DNA polymerase [Methylococcales bacterium]
MGSTIFFDGYNQRNLDIATSLNKNPDQVAVVTDLKQFYPSAKKELVESALKSRLNNSGKELGVLGDAIFEFYSQLLSSGGNGIPIGPASSHVLGQLVLQEVDSVLTQKYGDKYFRYVDDIIIVCHENEAESAKRDIQDCIEGHGFSINADKTAITSGIEWKHHILRSDVSEEDNIRLLSSDLAGYLAFYPDRADELNKMFVDVGLSIPIGRLLTLSKYNRFRYFLFRKKAFNLVFSTNTDFLKRGLRLKKVYEDTLSEFIRLPAESLPNLRRWQVQRSRRVINSLFYLRNFDEWKNPSGTFEAFPELVEQRALAKALSSGNVNPILPFYGSVGIVDPIVQTIIY